MSNECICMLGQSTSLNRLGHVFWFCVTRQLLLAVGAGCMEQDYGWTVQKISKECVSNRYTSVSDVDRRTSTTIPKMYICRKCEDCDIVICS